MNILGINAYHGDSSACLVVDGKVICAVEEERIRRIKHWAGFPSCAIKWCLSYSNIGIKELDYVAISRKPSAHLHKKLIRAFLKTPQIKFIQNRFNNVLKIGNIKNQIADLFHINENVIKAEVVKIEHHIAHIASAFLVSPFEKATCVSIDGFGDFLSVMRAKGEGTQISILDWVEFPHSLGILYTAFTQFLGFCNYGDEYKVMGLAACGEPIYKDEVKKLIRYKENGLFELDCNYFKHAHEGVEMVWDNGSPSFNMLFSDKFIEYFGKPRLSEEKISKQHMDIAASIQAVYEETFFHILNDTYKRTRLENVTLAGGCIQNSLANGKIYDLTSFKNVYIPPAAYDAGTAIGAAIAVWYKKSKKSRSFIMDNPYLGPSFSEEQIDNELRIFHGELDNRKYQIEKITEDSCLCSKVASQIAQGKIVGWFQGRTEFGPRALGNRSILADPRKPEIKETLNKRIKRREWFRPFAPSILEEKVAEWFESSIPVPFMEKVYKIKEEKRGSISAVCHVDSTGRLQTVSNHLNLKYYKLIKEFESETGVPLLLNTSFNENEPIVNSPKDALQCFLSTQMDLLVLENTIITKKE